MTKTLAIFYPGCVEFEIMLVTELINSKFPVEVATPKGDDHQGSNGMKIIANKSYYNVDVTKYKIILVPGGDPESVISNKQIDEILQRANKQGSIIGAICAGPLVLAKAGLIKGRNFTHGYGDHYKDFLKPYWAEANFFNEQVVSDGNIITAQPQGHIDFAVDVAVAAGVYTDLDKAKYLKRYYRGLI